jgi:glucoamylase
MPVVSVKVGQPLSVCLPAPAMVRWGTDGWQAVTDTPTRDTGLGVHVAELPVRQLSAGQWIDFTFRWSDPDRWEGQDFRVGVV